MTAFEKLMRCASECPSDDGLRFGVLMALISEARVGSSPEAIDDLCLMVLGWKRPRLERAREEMRASILSMNESAEILELARHATAREE